MNSIVFKINKNNLVAAVLKKDTPKDDLNNTNIINTKEIYFSIEYVSNNLELVSSFLNVIILKQNVNRITIKDYEVLSISLDVIKSIPTIKEVIIKPDKIISYDIFLKILDNKYINKIEAFDIPKYLLERLDINKDLNVNLRCEMLFISFFMDSNKLNTYSDIFYKKSISIKNKFNEADKNDFITFLNINKYLKVIEFSYFDNEIFNFIMNQIIRFNIINLKIVFNEEFVKIENIFKTVNNYKNKHEKELKEKNINFKINYSEEYKRNNMFKQINLNVIKVALIAIILVVTLMMGINVYHNYIDTKKSAEIEKDLEELLNINYNNTIEDNDDDTGLQYIEPNKNDKELLKSTTTTTTIYDIKYKMVFDELRAINKDTVGWLKVNNTNIDYPVVLGKDNDFYLKRDFYQNINRHGWIFMDYRNNVERLSKNTIIYGHNLANQKMFGTLRYALNSAWYKKTSNQIITFNSINKNMKWQIFSIYKVPVTSDYLITDFSNDNKYLEFLKLITNRSIYDFKQELKVTDKILTLSTCSNGSDQRLVIHAKLITE